MPVRVGNEGGGDGGCFGGRQCFLFRGCDWSVWRLAAHVKRTAAASHIRHQTFSLCSEQHLNTGNICYFLFLSTIFSIQPTGRYAALRIGLCHVRRRVELSLEGF